MKANVRQSLDKLPSSRSLAMGLSPPAPSSPAIAAAMRGNRANDTTPEVLLRSALWKSGIRRYRKHLADVPGHPDIAFPHHRLAVFVHGCFWHSCPKCNISIPATNRSYWEEKLRRNKERDKRVLCELKEIGWHSIELWECEIQDSLEWSVNQIQQKLLNLDTNQRASSMSETSRQ